MIIGKKEDLQAYRGLNPRIDMAIDYILTLDPNVEDGTYELDGKKVYAIVSTGTTKVPEQKRYELHRRYLDLQYVIEGEEELGYAHITDCTPDEPYSETKEREFQLGNGATIPVKSGWFYLAHPFDGHMPMRSSKPGTIRKAIVKILL